MKIPSFVAIDPGDLAGIAMFVDGKLTHVELVKDAVARCWRWSGPFGLPVVCEIPTKFHLSQRTQRHASVDSLLTLSFTAGYLVSALQPSWIRKVNPREWKGQRPKPLDNALVMHLLEDQERHILDEARISAAQRHNAVDAIGIGLWYLRRR